MEDNSFINKFTQSISEVSKNLAARGAAIPDPDEQELIINPGLEALITDSIAFGKKLAYTELLEMARNRICFDYKIGNCDHPSCHEMQNIVIEIEKKKHQNESDTE